MNRELKDFTAQIPGGFAAIRVERPLLSVTSCSTATCKEFKLAKVLLVPDPSLICHSLPIGPHFLRRLSVSSGEWLSLHTTRPVSPLSEQGDNHREVTKPEYSFVAFAEKRECCPTLPAIGPPLAGKSGKW